jgi:glycosidase
MFRIRNIILLFLVLLVPSCKKDSGTSSNNDDAVTPFNNVPSTEDIVMYEVNFRAFSETGDFNGVTNKLDHIKSLGVNVIWLMPIHPIGNINSVNSPYSVRDYKDVNPEFGTIADFKKLVNESHKKNMAVIIDWVANHTAWDNPWIENKSWYTQDAHGEIIIPPGTNWQDVAELNYTNDTMRLAMIDAMKFWVTGMNVDGFRCDAADFIPTDFWAQAIDTLEHIHNRKLILLAEGSKAEQFDAGFQMNYAWDFFTKLKDVYINSFSAGSLFTTHAQEYATIPAGKHKLRYITNHDESAWNATPIELFGGVKSSFSAFVITTCLGGVPLVYGSQEVGVQNKISFFSKNPIDWTKNPDLLSKYQKLLTTYSESKVLRTGTMETFSHNDIVAFKKTLGGNEALIIVNVRNKSVSYNVPAALQNTIWSNSIDGSKDTINSVVELGAFDYYVLTTPQ